MRYVLVIADGSALASEGEDLYAALDAAETPALDAMGRLGKVGIASPAGGPSYVRGVLTLMGVQRDRIATVSDAVAEAAGAGVPLAPGDAAVRLGLVRVSPDDADGLLLGGCDDCPEEARALFDDLVAHWRDGGLLDDAEIAGSGAERLLIVRAGAHSGGRDLFAGVETVPPQAIRGEAWVEHLPDAGHARDSRMLCELISASRHFLAGHPVNTVRNEQGLDPINLAWAWDPGVMPDLASETLDEAVRNARWCIAEGSGSGAGLCALLKVDTMRAPIDGLAPALLAGVESQDGPTLSVAIVRTDAPTLDASVVHPLLEGLAGCPLAVIGDLDDAPWRLQVAVSHDPGGLAAPGGGWTPFALAGGRVRSVVDRRLSGAMGSDLRVEPASDLMEYVLRSGLRGVV